MLRLKPVSLRLVLVHVRDEAIRLNKNKPDKAMASGQAEGDNSQTDQIWLSAGHSDAFFSWWQLPFTQHLQVT